MSPCLIAVSRMTLTWTLLTLSRPPLGAPEIYFGALIPPTAVAGQGFYPSPRAVLSRESPFRDINLAQTSIEIRFPFIEISCSLYSELGGLVFGTEFHISIKPSNRKALRWNWILFSTLGRCKTSTGLGNLCRWI